MSDSYDRLRQVSEVPTEPHSHLSRCKFLGVSAATSVAATLSPLFAASEKRGDMPYRALGRTGEKVSLIGLGGGHIATKTYR